MNLCTAFRAIRWIWPCCFSSQRRWNRFAINGLPFPLDPPLSSIEAEHAAHNSVPDTSFLPSLKSFMQNTARHTKPISMNGFPLTAGPQHIPNAIDHRSIFRSRTAGTSFLGWFGKFSFDDTPQRTWDPKVIYIFGFCDILAFAYFAPRWLAFFIEHYFPRGAFIF